MVAPWAVDLARLDRDLVDEIAAVEPQVQRAMAAWARQDTTIVAVRAAFGIPSI